VKASAGLFVSAVLIRPLSVRGAFSEKGDGGDERSDAQSERSGTNGGLL
jgi:hypothetical protein